MLSLLSKLLFGKRKAPARESRALTLKKRDRVKAQYDNAQTTPDNRNHWKGADSSSAEAANSADVRKTLRERSRMEFQNNSYFHGMVQTLANDTFGTGPRLQVLLDNQQHNQQIEQAFAEWCEAVNLPEKLRILSIDKVVAGEAFAVLVNNDQLPTAVQMDVRTLDCDLCAAPLLKNDSNNYCDGITFDNAGTPVSYDFLKQHPGDLGSWNMLSTAETIKADKVIHWFRKDRSGQVHGIPEGTPSLGLFGQLRRIALAVLSAFEAQTDHALVLETTSPADPDDTGECLPFEEYELTRGMATALPFGTKLGGLTPTQPAATFEMFERRMLIQIGRCQNVPYVLLGLDSSASNFSSARMDLLNYRTDRKVVRDHGRRIVLDRIFRAWLEEAVMIPGLLPPGITPANLKFTHHFSGWPAIDPYKDALADDIRLGNGSLTLAELTAERDGDLEWEQKIEQQARERKKRDELGVPNPMPKYQDKNPDAVQQVDQISKEEDAHA